MGSDELTESQLEYLAKLPASKLRQWLKPRPATPKTLVLPSFVPEEITETAPELAQAAESTLANLLRLSEYISSRAEPGSRDGRDLVWQLDVKKAEALPLFGKLKSLSPSDYARIVSEFEWLVLSPYAPQKPVGDPRGKAIADRVCADRSFGRDERARPVERVERGYCYFSLPNPEDLP